MIRGWAQHARTMRSLDLVHPQKARWTAISSGVGKKGLAAPLANFFVSLLRLYILYRKALVVCIGHRQSSHFSHPKSLSHDALLIPCSCVSRTRCEAILERTGYWVRSHRTTIAHKLTFVALKTLLAPLPMALSRHSNRSLACPISIGQPGAR